MPINPFAAAMSLGLGGQFAGAAPDDGSTMSNDYMPNRILRKLRNPFGPGNAPPAAAAAATPPVAPAGVGGPQFPPPSPLPPGMDPNFGVSENYGKRPTYGIIKPPTPDTGGRPLDAEGAITTPPPVTSTSSTGDLEPLLREYLGKSDTRLANIEARRAQMTAPQTLKQKLLRGAFDIGAPLLARAAGGPFAGAGAAQGVLGAERNAQAIRQHELDRAQQEQMAEEGQNRGLLQTVMQERMMAPYREAQADYFKTRAQQLPALNESQINLRNAQADLADVKTNVGGFAPRNPSAAGGSEFMRIWAAEHPDKPIPTLADRIQYEKDRAAAHPAGLQLHFGSSNEPYVFDPRGGTATTPGGSPGGRQPITPTAKLPGTVESTLVQSEAITNGARDLVGTIPSIAQYLGPGVGRWTKLEQMWGDPDPKVQAFATQLGSWLALQPKLHGFRGQQALHEFDRMVGGIKMTPEALTAAIQGMAKGGAGTVGGAIKKRFNIPEKVEEYVRDANGHLVLKQP